MADYTLYVLLITSLLLLQLSLRGESTQMKNIKPAWAVKPPPPPAPPEKIKEVIKIYTKTIPR